jgi:hypothetical protein
VDYNSLGCGIPWEHVVIFEVDNLTKLFPEETGTLGFVLCSRFGLKRYLATPCISTKSSIFHLSTLWKILYGKLQKTVTSIVREREDVFFYTKFANEC